MQAPNPFDHLLTAHAPPPFTVFLAGSIEQGTAEDWQHTLFEAFLEYEKKEEMPRVVFMNPRRATWQPEWPQDASFPPFREQVEWELKALEVADVM